jgi:hypothetical protein
MSEELGSGSEQHMDKPTPEIVGSEVGAPPPDDGSLWDRRTFFKSAALGTAAAAMVTGGRMVFGPVTAYADVLTNVNCTANDVRISGPGIIVNEECDCDGTFNAQVQFRVINNTGTTRYCVTVHLCDGLDEEGNVVFPATDLIVGDIGPNFDGPVTVTIPNYPCGAGLVCFGEAGSAPDGGFAKGETCPTGECCTVISWNVRPNDVCPQPHGDIIKSKCRAQQVCIQGRGDTTIACPAAGCAVPCGGSIGLTVCTDEPSSEGPFIIQLFECGGTTPLQSFGPTTDKCHTFTVSPTATTCYFGRVISTQDTPDCVKDSEQVTVTVQTITPTIAVAGNANCTTGLLTLTASPSDCDVATYAWFIDGVAAGTGNPFTYQPNADTVCHTVRVDVNCDGCLGSAERTISQCVQTTLDC